MRLLLSLTLTMLLPILGHAQNVDFDWVKNMGGSPIMSTRGMVQDDSGNVFLVGCFVGTRDFEPGSGTYNMAASGYDSYILKLDSAGDFVWAKKFSGGGPNLAFDITIGPSGNLYVTGKFVNATDFDPGSGNTNTNSTGGWDGYVVKLSPQGAFGWVKTFAGTGSAMPISMDVDAAENVFITGKFNGSIDLDPGASTDIKTVGNNFSLFCVKLDSAGSYQWGHYANTSNIDLNRTDDLHSDIDIAVSSGGEAYITGVFQGTVDFDFGSSTNNLTSSGSYDVFLLKLDTAGNHAWSHKFGSTGGEWFGTVAVDEQDMLYLAASYVGTVDFDPGSSNQYVTVNGRNVVVVKFDSSATFQWATEVDGSATTHAKDIFIDHDGQVFIAGGTQGTADFDPSSGTDYINGSFVAKYESNGDYAWAKRIMAYNEGVLRPDHLSVNSAGHVYTAGSFYGTHDFDPDPSATHAVAAQSGNYDIFLHKMQAVCSNTEETQYVTACGSYTWIDSVTYTASTDTPSVTFAVAGGCDSVVNLSLFIHEYPEVGVTASDTVICQDESIEITIDTAHLGNQYYLREGMTVLAGPVAGTDSALSFSVDSIQASSSYNIMVSSDSTASALNLPNNNDYVRFEEPFVDFDKQLTVEAWVKFDSTENPRLGQASPMVDNMTQNVWLWEGNAFYVNDNGTWRFVNFPTSIPNGWVHVATVADTSGLYIYYDGTLVASVSTGLSNGILFNKHAVLDLGHDPRFIPGTPNRNTDLPIDNFMVWDTVRTVSQIQSDMQNCLSGNEAGLVHYTKLNEGTGNMIYSEKGCIGLGYNTSSNLWVTGAGVCYENCSIQMLDSVNVTVNMPTAGTQTEVACDSFTWSVNNQTYTTSGTHVDTLTNVAGCDSVVTLNLTVNYSNAGSQTEVACDSYTWSANNQTYTSSGVYVDTLSNAAGCDSVVTLNLTVNYSDTGSQTVVACDSYTWSANNQTYTTSGVYLDTIATSLGCDSMVTLNLTINYSDTGSQTEEVCDSYTWPANNTTYFTSGVYIDTLSTTSGCDSVVTLNLTVNYSDSTDVVEVACDSYTWAVNNVTYTTSGTYIDTLSTTAGCDSIVTLFLTVNYSDSSSQTEVACNSYTWLANNQTYTSSGIYVDTIATALGCDSIVELNLTVHYSDTSVQTEVVCDSFMWAANNTTYTSSGTYVDTLATTNGCDSVVWLDLTILASTSAEVEVYACDSFVLPSGASVTSSGTYVDTISNQAGCDSVVTSTLFISTLSGDVDCNGEYNGNEIAGDENGDGVITFPEIAGDTDGNGVIDGDEIAGDTNGNGVIDGDEIAGDLNGDGQISDGEIIGDVNGDGVIGTGEIAGDINGDGVINNDEVEGDGDGDGIADNVGIKEAAPLEAKVFPNPTTGTLTIELAQHTTDLRLRLYSIAGSLIDEVRFGESGRQLNYEFDVPAGTYLLELSSSSMQAAQKRVVKL